MLQNKHVLDEQFSESLCFNFMHCAKKKKEKNNLSLARLAPRNTSHSNDDRRYNFQALANISENLQI